MMSRITRERGRGTSLIGALVACAAIAALAGMLVSGFRHLRRLVAETQAEHRATQLGYALHMHWQRQRGYPSDYPAYLQGRLSPYLNQDLKEYIDNAAAFEGPGRPEQGVEPVNTSYVCPPHRRDANRYVLCVEAAHPDARAAVLFANDTVELVDTLEVRYGDQALKPAAVVTGGTVTFATGTKAELGPKTTLRVIRSFRTPGGSVLHVVKLPRYLVGTLRAHVTGNDIMQVVTGAGVVCVSRGVADIDVVPVESEEDPAEASEDDYGDDPAPEPVDTEPPAPPPSLHGALGPYAVFSKTSIRFDSNSLVDHLIGSNGNVSLGSNCRTKGIEGGGSLLLDSNLEAEGDVVFTGPVSMDSNSIVSGSVDSLGRVTLLGDARVGRVIAGGNFLADSNARVSGNVIVDGSITLKSNSKIWGRAEYTGSFSGKSGRVVGGAARVDSVTVTPREFQPVTLPPPTEFSPGTQKVSVKDSRRTIQPGAYGELRLDGEAKVTLTAGTYCFTSIYITGKPEVHLDASDGEIEILVSGNVTIDGDASAILDGDTAASDIYLETHGNCTITGKVTWKGTVFVPDGTFRLDGDSRLDGACYADGAVEIGSNSSLVYAQSKRKIGSGYPAEADDGNGDEDDGGDDGEPEAEASEDTGPPQLMHTYVKISNHSAEVTADSRIIERGNGVLPVAAGTGQPVTARSLGMGVQVPVGEWAEVTTHK
jgi:cytoskeletal protein CcmA (bactofilin family)